MKITELDTRQGTDNTAQLSHGNTLPLTGKPFAMNYFTIQNQAANGSWFFNPYARRFEGFRLTHQPSPWMGDFSHFTFLPLSLSAENCQTQVDLAGSFDPKAATFNPAQLQINDQHYRVRTQLVPCTYGAIWHSHYQQTNKLANLLLTFPGKTQLKLDPQSQRLQGEWINFSGCEDPEFTCYFELAFDQPFNLKQTFQRRQQHLQACPGQTSFSGDDLQIVLTFATQELTTRLATSFISPEQATANLDHKQSTSLSTELAQTQKAWENYLNRIEIHDDQHPAWVKTLYTTLYRLFLFPQRFYEYDQQTQEPIHYNTKKREPAAGKLYTNNGFWDTSKTVYPLLSLIAPELIPEFLSGFLTSYQETGFLPKWLSPDERGMMPGTLIDAVIADAASKHLLSKPMLQTFLTAMIHGATQESDDPKYGRRGTADYLKYGYVPDSHGESVNHTLDYAYSDYCIAVVAQALGDDKTAHHYQKQARNYRHLFDPETGFMRPKNTAGEFAPGFDALRWGGAYTEGGPWQNSFSVYQDIAGLIDLYGGAEPAYQKLADLVNTPPYFEVGTYGSEIHEMTEMVALNFGQLALSNQPSFHIPYLFTYVHHPEMTQLLVKQLLTQAFNAGFQGYPGDEDNGSMAGWYVLSALGFYPVTPGSGQYVLGIPLFDQVIIHLPQGKKLVLTTENNQEQAQFVQKRSWNQQPYTKLYVTHEQLQAGGELQTTLALVPPTNQNTGDLPYSLSHD